MAQEHSTKTIQLLGMLLLFQTQNIQAQQAVQQVEVKAKSETENTRREASAKTVVESAQLLQFGDTNVSEAMRRVPGVIVNNGVIQLAGMGSNYTQILVDGEPLRGSNIDHIPMNMIARVEIYRLGSAEFSSAAIAGTINIVRKKIPTQAKQEIKFSVSDAYAPSAKLEWRAADKRDNLTYALSLSAGVDRNIFGAPRMSAVTVRDLSEHVISEYDSVFIGKARQKQLSLHPEFQYKTPTGMRISANSAIAFSRDQVGTDRYYETVKGAPLPVAHNQDRFSDSFQSASSNFKLNGKLWTDVSLDLLVGISGNYSKIHSREFDFTKAAKLELDRNMHRTRRSGGLNSTLKLSLPTLAQHDIVGGWSGSSQVNNDQRLSVDIDTSSLDFPKVTSDDQTAHSLVSRWAFFIQDDWRFQKASTASMGLRWETVRVETAGNQLLPVQNSVSVWSPIAQTLWQLNPDNTDRLRLGVARSYKAPSNFQLVTPSFKRTNNSIENPHYRANPNLQAELAWSLETAYEHNGADHWNYNLRAVIRKIENLHRADVRKIENEWWRQFINAGQALSKTLSMDTQFPLKRFVAESPEINVSFAVNKSWSSVSSFPKPDNLLTPTTLSANLNIDFRSKDYPLNLSANLRYRDGNPMLVSLSQRELSRAQTNLDLLGIWKFNQKTTLRVSMDNALKRAYSSGNQFYAQEVTTTQIDTQVPYRLLRVNLEHSF